MKYMAPPVRFESIDLPEKAYVGLVLDVKHTYLFASVLVNHPDERKAGWINIWTSKNKFGLHVGCRFATWSPPGSFVDEAPATFQRGSCAPPGRTASAAAAPNDEQPAKVPRTREGESSSAGGNLCKEPREIRLCDRIEVERQSAEPPAADTIEVDYDPDGTNPDETFTDHEQESKDDEEEEDDHEDKDDAR